MTKAKNLNYGALVIELYMRLDESKSRLSFIPKNPVGTRIQQLLFDEESSDILFDVSGDDASQNFHYCAHLLILKACAPDLARLCEGCDKSSLVPINDVEPHIFMYLLQYIYGCKVPAVWEEDAEQIIDAADKYGVVDLKVEAEAWYVTYNTFSVGNVINELLYADAKSLPLLREAAMEFILKNARDVIKSDSFHDVMMTKTITKEIMLAMAKAVEEKSVESNNDNIMSVTDLRMALDEKGLNVDGSREMLESRLNEYHNMNEEEEEEETDEDEEDKAG